MIIKTIENVDAVRGITEHILLKWTIALLYTGMLETTDRTLHVITSCN